MVKQELDVHCLEILKAVKEVMKEDGIKSPSYSDAIRELFTQISDNSKWKKRVLKKLGGKND